MTLSSMEERVAHRLRASAHCLVMGSIIGQITLSLHALLLPAASGDSRRARLCTRRVRRVQWRSLACRALLWRMSNSFRVRTAVQGIQQKARIDCRVLVCRTPQKRFFSKDVSTHTHCTMANCFKSNDNRNEQRQSLSI